jgi:hypothetical protein
MSIGILPLRAQEPGTGSIVGTVIDRETRQPVSGAKVVIADATRGAYTNGEGKFRIESLPPGNYRLGCSSLGYEPSSLGDVVVKPGRPVTADIELAPGDIAMPEVTVNAGYFSSSGPPEVSSVEFSSEEIRRAPGSAGDISRILMELPSVAKTNDTKNSLLVRGGNPSENSFYIDNIEIPNINHFPTQGASGGPIGILNVDFIRNVRFHAGGFPVQFGDRLSSVMDISFREGSREKTLAQLDLNFAGYGAVVEGPLVSSSASWMLSARRSYLDLIVKAVSTGTSLAPSYNDYQGKISWNIDPSNSVSLLAVVSDDHSHSDNDIARENEQTYYGDQDTYQYVTGANWRAVWGKGYSNTSLSYAATDFGEKFFEAGTGRHLITNASLESALALRNVSTFMFSDDLTLVAGVEARMLHNRYNNAYGEYLDQSGRAMPAYQVASKLDDRKLGAFASLTVKPFDRLSLTLGARADYDELAGGVIVQPRIAAGYMLDDRTTISASAGLFAQTLPMLLLAQRASYRDLDVPKAGHYVLGVQHMLSDETRLTVEAYYKGYRSFPQSPAAPDIFVVDDILYNNDFIRSSSELVSNGRAESYGAELTLQRKFAGDFYGLCALSLYRSRYRTMSGAMKDRAFDNRVTFSIEGGYELSDTWELSARWIYAGGAPYTPFDLEASTAAHTGIIDTTRINGARYPDYHSLNIRLEKRFNFASSGIVAYVSVWNVYNRQNIASYYWNNYRNEQGAQKQFGILPIFGIEWDI